MKINSTFKIIVIIKIIILFVFSSEYNSILFQPFVNTFINNGLLNPWQFYLEHNLNLDSFPYHSIMLLILCPFAVLSNLFHFDALFKLPLLFADIGILYVLLKTFPNKVKSVYLFYFLNPIIVYAIYIHSQLDIIPTAILLYSIYLLMVNKNNYSSLVFGLALATKIHIIIALPLLFFYLYKIKNIKVALKYIAVSLTVFLLFDLPFLFSEGFIQMVLLNPKQSLLFDSFYNIGSVNILLPIAAILMIYQLKKIGEKNIALRFSEFEGIDTIIAMSGKVEWVWVDCFTKLPINTNSFLKLKENGFKLCLVSPELQGQDDKIEIYKIFLNENLIIFDAICTKGNNIFRWID